MEKNLIINVAIKNIGELTDLIEKAQHQGAELANTMHAIEMFEPEISYPTLEQKQQ
ncbi:MULTISPECIES: hypothetical protein [Leuconostoc]|uniref:Uncharacterized protein n=2 Tax=Leuconostoc TaxID=1243 RepID=A0ABM9V485_9LACO|nr:MULTISPECIES: hypothetical protein [Leuconostoc]MBZ6015428.1 hypothetical protein [Leuconostoc gelidum subsp. gelidum]CUW12499.1 hypothetical protein KSL4_0842 [Leuconostoc inhae]